MPTYKEHKHGTFSWVELGTTNADAAKRFYGELLGWTFEDMPAGPDMIYSMAKIGSNHVGALYKMGDQMKGVPPNWGSYITVDNVDEISKKVTQYAGKIVKEPFDVIDVGRMAVAQDPSGATINFWQ